LQTKSNFIHSKSKLRKRDEVALGPQYAGSRITREALLGDDDDSGDSESDAEQSEENAVASRNFADPEDVDVDVDEDDGDIDSDVAFGESDTEKFKDFTFRGSSKPGAINEKKRRPTAADFMSESEVEDDMLDGAESDDAKTDEEVLDIDGQHATDVVKICPKKRARMRMTKNPEEQNYAKS
jgi:protein AATF/BFR2